MVKVTHRSTVLSLLPFDPGEVQQELIATPTAAKVINICISENVVLEFCRNNLQPGLNRILMG